MINEFVSRRFGALCIALGSVVLFANATRATAAQPTPSLQLPAPLSEDDTGFVSIFDGKSLRGWDGDPTYWRVEGGCIVGQTTSETLLKLKENRSFIIWQRGMIQNFELKFQYRVSRGGNSGVNYRSEALSEPKWDMRGYQFDIDGSAWGRDALLAFDKGLTPIAPFVHFRVTGQTYEEHGRQFLALPGQLTRIATGEPQRVIGDLSDAGQIEEITREEDWNDGHIIARDSLLIHILNGHVTSMVIDDDTKNRQLQGTLGLEVHVGAPMRVEFRNIRLKTL
jgi:hypothetical protein